MDFLLNDKEFGLMDFLMIFMWRILFCISMLYIKSFRICMFEYLFYFYLCWWLSLCFFQLNNRFGY